MGVSKMFRARVLTMVLAAVLTVSLAACTSSGPGQRDGTESPSPTVEPTSDVQEPEPDQEPGDVEPTGVPFETEPETVDVAVPEVVDPGEPSEVDGRDVLDPVEIDDAVAETTREVTVWLERFVAVEDAGSRPGEVGGPAVQFDLFIHNGGAEPLDLATFVVHVAYGEQEIPAEDVLTEESRPVTGIVAPDETLRGTLVFVIPPEERSDVLITVDIAADAHVIAFQGETPR